MYATAYVRSRLSVPDSAHDTLLAQLEAEAVIWFQNQTRRYFGEPQDVYELLSGAGASGAGVVWLADDPIVDEAGASTLVMSYRVPTTEFASLDFTVMPAGSYQVIGRRVHLYASVAAAGIASPSVMFGADTDSLSGVVMSGWPLGALNLRADYTRGYAIAGTGDTAISSAPEDVRNAILATIAQMLRERLPAVGAAASAMFAGDDVQGSFGGSANGKGPKRVPPTVLSAIETHRVPTMSGIGGDQSFVFVKPVIE